MKTREQVELENLALAAELSRQLVHDFSNFVHNLFLQIEICKVSVTAADPQRWEPLKKEGQKIERSLREWEHFQVRFSFAEVMLDLHELIRQLAGELSSQDRKVHLVSSIPAEPFFVASFTVGAKHLLRLLIEDAVSAWVDTMKTTPTVSIETENADMKARVRIVAKALPEEIRGGAEKGNATPDEVTESSLVAATCRSLAVRLGASIQRTWVGGRYVSQVEFPLAMSSKQTET